jgi:amino-acid N-acetyltransferase
MHLRRASPADFPGIERVLIAAALPLDGAAEAFELGIIAEDGADTVGGAAVEPYDGAGLLRSVAVREHLRGHGIGRAVVGAAEDLARESGAANLYLLTESAEGWFGRLGYRRIGRDEVPADVRRSVEFTVACSDSAVAMVKPLGTPERR